MSEIHTGIFTSVSNARYTDWLGNFEYILPQILVLKQSNITFVYVRTWDDLDEFITNMRGTYNSSRFLIATVFDTRPQRRASSLGMHSPFLVFSGLDSGTSG